MYTGKGQPVVAVLPEYLAPCMFKNVLANTGIQPYLIFNIQAELSY